METSPLAAKPTPKPRLSKSQQKPSTFINNQVDSSNASLSQSPNASTTSEHVLSGEMMDETANVHAEPSNVSTPLPQETCSNGFDKNGGGSVESPPMALSPMVVDSSVVEFPALGVENPEYVNCAVLRQNSKAIPSKRTSDLMWFTSGVPPQFANNVAEEAAKRRLYPDLSEFLLFDTKIDEKSTDLHRPPSLKPADDSLNGFDSQASTPSPQINGKLEFVEDSTSENSQTTEIPKSVDAQTPIGSRPSFDSQVTSPHQLDSQASGPRSDVDSQANAAVRSPIDAQASAAVRSPVDSQTRSHCRSNSQASVHSEQSSLPPILSMPPRCPVSAVPHRTSSTSTPIACNVCYVGWLTKMGQKKKDCVRRWCVLQHDEFSIYNNENDEKCLETIPCKSISMVGVDDAATSSYLSGLRDSQVPNGGEAANQAQNGFVVFYHNSKDSTKCEKSTFVTDCLDDRTAWLTFLAKSIIHGETAELCERIDRAGPVFLKQGTTAEWESGWLVMIGSTLLYSSQSDECSFEIDIRKIKGLRSVDDHSDFCPMVKNSGHNNQVCPFGLTTQGSALYVQSSHGCVTETWKGGIESILTQRSSSLVEQRLNLDDVPILIEKCINFIAVHGMNVEGIHRLSGTSSKIRLLCAEFQKDPYAVHLRLEDYSVHDVASVLRKFLRQLREPLVTSKLRPKFVETSCFDEMGTRRLQCKNVLGELPRVNYQTLRKILGHLKGVSDNCHVNMMSVQNLAAIFGPTLFSVDRDALEGVTFTSTTQAITIVADMIKSFNWLFNVEEAEMEKETKIQQVANNLTRTTPQKPLAGELLFSIHTVQRDGLCFNMQITSRLTPSDICDFAISRQKINALREEVSLFEVVCNGELQRLVWPDEKVLDVISRWTTWPLEERANNFLIVKLDFVTDRVKTMVTGGQNLCTACDVQFSETKNFKKFTFQFNQGSVVQFKDSKAKKELNQWKAENLLWYFGCEAKRQAPSKNCLTFLNKDDLVRRTKSMPFFGKCMCFKDEQEMYKWLCTVLLVNHSFMSKSEF